MENQIKKRVLVVDDIKSNLLVMYSILRKDYALILARNGAEAIRRAREHAPDLILLDILMPEMDGYEVFAELKNHDSTRDIPVIFTTGLSDPDDHEKGLSLGAADYINKPFDPAIVKRCVQKQVG